MTEGATPPRRASSGGVGANQPSAQSRTKKGSGAVKVRPGHGQLSHLDLLVLREMLSDLIADPAWPRLPLMDGELTGSRLLTDDEWRAVGNLEVAIETSRPEKR